MAEKLCNPLEDEVSYKVTLRKMKEKKENLKMEGNNRICLRQPYGTHKHALRAQI
jgi:hypothetical protein